MTNDVEIDIEYLVVTNDEEQYSIWPCLKSVPAGWNFEGYSGPKQECLSYIESVWKDMRPLSLRKKMREREQLFDQLIKEAEKKPAKKLGPSSLVQFLTKQMHNFTLHANEKNEANFRSALKQGLFHIIIQNKEHEICLRVDFEIVRKDELDNDFKQISFKGLLEVDFVPLLCIGTIDQDTKKGCCEFNLN